MKKRFKAKKSHKFNILKIIAFVLIGCFSFVFCFKFFYNNIKEKLSSEDIIDYLVKTSINTDTLLDVLSYDSTNFLLKYTLGYDSHDDTEDSGTTYEYVADPNPDLTVDNPIVYIYNSHQTEGYVKSGTSEYGITPTVMHASYILREKLNNNAISTIVETNNISEILNINGWNYASSYKASRILLEDAKSNNSTLTYYIDIHRDSADYQYTTTTIDGVSYAKVYFIIGGNNENYEENLAFATALNEKFKNIDESLTRGISIKSGSGSNGIYNQDFSGNAILIEVGGQYNNIVEVSNTIELLSNVLYEYIMEA